MTTKSGQIREYVRDHPGADNAKIASGTGIAGAFVATITAQRVKAKEFLRDKDGGHTMNAKFKSKRGGGAHKRKPKKMRGFKGEKRARAKRAAAAQLAEVQAVTPAPQLRHVRSTFAMLEAIIEIDEADTVLRAAFAVHKESIELAVA
jgi:hypothetical protein